MPLPYRIVAVQSCTAAVLASLWFLMSAGQGVSSILASLAVIVPNGLFAWQVASRRSDNGLEEARRLVAGSVAKLALGVGLLVGIFVWYRPEPASFFTTLIVVYAAQLVAPLLATPRRSRASDNEKT